MTVRYPAVVLAAGLALLTSLPTAAEAQSIPTVLFSGTVRQNFVWNDDWCAIPVGVSDFRRAGGAFGPALVSLDRLHFYGGSSHYPLSGQAKLVFTGPTAGRINFPLVAEYPATVRSPEFTGYSQSYDSAQRQLTVAFNIKFPNCVLRINGVYRQ